jgi:transcription initiation factor IIE alpha subunit
LAKARGEDREIAKNRLKSIMMKHVGPSKKISMAELHQAVYERPVSNISNDTRTIRKLVAALREEGIFICSDERCSEPGYWLAATDSERDDFCGKLRRAALKKLAQEAALKGVSLSAVLNEAVMGAERVL